MKNPHPPRGFPAMECLDTACSRQAHSIQATPRGGRDGPTERVHPPAGTHRGADEPKWLKSLGKIESSIPIATVGYGGAKGRSRCRTALGRCCAPTPASRCAAPPTTPCHGCQRTDAPMTPPDLEREPLANPHAGQHRSFPLERMPCRWSQTLRPVACQHLGYQAGGSVGRPGPGSTTIDYFNPRTS